jgi:hypothetical protein
MSQHFLLPCECGNQIPVTTAQAGRLLACSCGREVKAPSLGGLRQLAPAQAGNDNPAIAWNAGRGILFVAGVLLTLLGLLVGGYGSYIFSQINVAAVTEHFDLTEVADIENVDKMSPSDAYDVWKVIVEHGLGQAGTAPPLQAQQWSRFYFTVTIIGFVTAAVGLAMAAGSLVRSAPRRS